MSILTKDGKVFTTSDGGTLNMNSLINKANEATGKNDKTLGDAVDSLIARGENKLQKLLSNEPVAITAEDLAGVTEITQYSGFNQKTNITSLELPEGLLTIDTYSFNGCRFEELHIPDTVTLIENGAFRNNPQLKILTLGTSVTRIGGDAFASCRGLTSVTIPDSVTSIDNTAFNGCTGITSLDLGNGLTKISTGAFGGIRISTLHIPESVQEIGGSAFANNPNLTTVTFGGTPTSITTWSFQNCPNLTQIKVPWAEGEVANAPWGATNATITYNYTPEGGNA